MATRTRKTSEQPAEAPKRRTRTKKTEPVTMGSRATAAAEAPVEVKVSKATELEDAALAILREGEPVTKEQIGERIAPDAKDPGEVAWQALRRLRVNRGHKIVNHREEGKVLYVLSE